MISMRKDRIGHTGQYDLLLNSAITIDEIQKAIRKVKCNKAAGVDGIPAEFYMHGSDKLVPALVFLFNPLSPHDALKLIFHP